ncbi:hypothetical protein [Massilia suwonensis]|uniref:Uncharacterized protein n=1 Tax=Massilia suwonensis TaxID=648895 RepID=A0ABW0MFX9_9BURK
MEIEVESGDSNIPESIWRIQSIFDGLISDLSRGRYERREVPQGIKSIHHRLNHLEAMIDTLRYTRFECAMRSESVLERFPQMLTALNDSKASTVGYKEFIKNLNGFFVEKTAVIVDPYIFSNGNVAQSDYCTYVLDMIGPCPQRIDFYFMKKDGYKKSVADVIFKSLTSRGCTVNLFECVNIHDRVLMKHFSTANDPEKSHWKGRVVGASANGIASRPTYVIDMPAGDAEGYSTYLSNVRKTATKHASPPV